MLSRMERLKQLCAAEGLLQCPVCGDALRVDGNALVCGSRHSYNLNRKGFVSFLNRPVSDFYDAALFEARGRVFASGAYDAVADALAELLPDKPCRLLDAGCGDGWYLRRLLEKRPDCAGAGIDLSRDAVAAAAGSGCTAVWCVGDLRRMPFADAAFDAVLDVLTPADYSSFRRVLKPGGCLLKVFPGGEYLKELRAARGLAPYEEGSVLAHLERHTRVQTLRRVRTVVPVDAALWRDFVYMTPLNADLTTAEKDAVPVSETVTVDLCVARVTPDAAGEA